jgi:hypothetical protein
MNEDLRLHGLIGGGGGSNIKSIQRGLVIATNSVNVTISSVDLANSVLIISYQGGGGTAVRNLKAMGKLTSSTNINFSLTTSAGYVTVNWQVVEFNNVKSIQRGDVTLSAASESVTINAVDWGKTMLLSSVKLNSTGTDLTYLVTDGGIERLTNTSIRLNTGNASNTGTAHWQVVEFK